MQHTDRLVERLYVQFRAPNCNGFLERQTASQLDETLAARRPCDLAVVARREGCRRVGEAHNVEGIGCFGAELEHDSMLEGNARERFPDRYRGTPVRSGSRALRCHRRRQEPMPPGTPGPLAMNAAVLNHAVNSLPEAQIRQR